MLWYALTFVSCCYCGIHATYNIELQPFMNYFPHVDIHELLTPDLLHQLIKGAFKDHIVSWIITYIKVKYPDQRTNQILDDIDRW